MQVNPVEDVDREIEGRSFSASCLVAVIIAALAIAGILFLFIRAGISPGPKLIHQIPSNFPKQFTLFQPEKIYEMYSYPAAAKQGITSFALSPIRLIMRATGQGDLPPAFQSAVSSVTDRDTVSFAWKDVSASPDDILRFYAGSFKQVGLLDPYVRQLDDRSAIEMAATSTAINASLIIIDKPNTQTLDTVTLVVEYPTKGIGGN